LSTARRNWFGRRLLDLWILVALTVCSPLGWPFAPMLCWFTLLTATLIPVHLAVTLRGRRGIELDDDGLTIVGWFGRHRFVPWTRITDLRDGGDAASFTADGGRFVLDADTVGWRRLYREIERHLRPEYERDEVGSSRLAQCLGIRAGGVLECRPRHLFVWSVAGLAFSVTVLALVLAFMDERVEKVLRALEFGSFAIVCGWSAWTQWRFRVVRADVTGLVAGVGRQRMSVPWAAVRSIERQTTRRARGPTAEIVVVKTDQGEIRFVPADKGGVELEEGIRRVLAERDAGRLLPSGAPLSDAALSRVRLTGESDAERGLSRVVEDEAG
jgi:hypothetical protein